MFIEGLLLIYSIKKHPMDVDVQDMWSNQHVLQQFLFMIIDIGGLLMKALFLWLL